MLPLTFQILIIFGFQLYSSSCQNIILFSKVGLVNHPSGHLVPAAIPYQAGGLEGGATHRIAPGSRHEDNIKLSWFSVVYDAFQI